MWRRLYLGISLASSFLACRSDDGATQANGATQSGSGGVPTVLGGVGGANGGGSSGQAGAAAGVGGVSASGGGGASGGATTGGMGGTEAGGSSGASSGSGGAGASSGSGGSSGSSGATSGGSSGSSGATSGGSGGANAGAGGSSSAGTTGSGGSWPAGSIQPGASDRLLLLGTVVTPDTTFDGAVLIEADKITCVDTAATCSAASGAQGATVVDTKGIILPGLIDMHNHVLFDVFDNDDWHPQPIYKNHNDWTDEPSYRAVLAAKHCLEDASQGKPTWCPADWNGVAASLKCELEKYGSIKSLIAGATSIVGLPGIGSPCYGSLSRSLGIPQNDLGIDKVQTSSLFPPSTTSADGVCANYASDSTDSYLIHVGEGTDAKALAEFQTLGMVTTTDGCLYAPETVITHGTAFTPAEWAKMGQTGMKLTWSPQSNVSLYGATADIPGALAAGVLVSLGPDWSMGGSVNMLDEMRFADQWDDARFGNVLSSKDLVAMATINAAQSLGLGDRLGTLAVGYLADIAVIAGDTTAPYDAILAARPRDVRLVLVGGRVLYGDANLQPAGPAVPGCEPLAVCGVAKFACIAESDTTNELSQTYADIEKALSDALTRIDGITDATKAPNVFSPIAPLTNCP